jgi:menaquinone-dependent protoporphyrinogen IX oxidase
VRVLIVYATKYGNTEKVAKLIGEGISSVEGNEVIVKNVKDINLKEGASYDLILIGSPNHFGKHVGSIKKFIDKVPKSQLKANAYAVFDTYILTDFEKAVKKMEQQITEAIPDLQKASPGLSIKVEGKGTSKGPITSEDLPKCKEFGIKLAQR